MKLLATIVAAAGIFGLASAAQAMPMAPTEAPSAITAVAGGCGPGWHPNPWGRCVPSRRVYHRAPPARMFYGPRHHRGYGHHRGGYGGGRHHRR